MRRLLLTIAAVLILGLGIGLFFTFYRGPSGPGGSPGPGHGGLPTVVAAVGNTCVECHRQIPEGALAGHGFREWEQSLHAARGVTCEACHGGDPSKGEKDQAHVGVLPSTDPQSKVYFKEIPQTCGGCHSPEFEAFRASVHYSQLKEEGRGPNCVTCHGAMAVSILTPSELEQACSACHNERLGIRPLEPIKARYVLMMSVQVRAYLDAVRELMELKRAAGKDVSKAEGDLTRAEKELQGVREGWHTFLVDRIEEGVQKGFAAVQEAVKDLDVEE